MQINQEVKAIFREMPSVHLESLAFTCQDVTTSDNIACHHINENAFLPNTSLEHQKQENLTFLE